MTPQEQQMIDGLISRIRSTQVQGKDTEAEQHIQQGLAGYPDALYVLTQTVLVQQYGLDQAQAQLNELKQQVQTLQEQAQHASQEQKGSGGSFLSHIFGGGSSSNQAPPQPQGAQYQPVNNPGYGQTGYPPPPPPPPYPQQGYPSQSYPPQGGGMFGGGGGGFLQGAMQTAAGVAAGEMVFQGMEDLFHGFGGHGGGYERGFGGGGGGETIINNYNDDDRGDRGDRGDNREDRGRDDSNFYNPSDDASRENFGDTSQNFADAGNNGGSLNDTAGFDNSNDFNDAGGFDDSSNDFSSSDDNS